MATPIGDSYTCASGGVIAAGRFVNTILAGEWQQLTVAPHSRKVISLAGNGTNGTFTPTNALAIEAQSAVSVSAIPVRAFSAPVLGGDGYWYYTGGLHSNYQGNEIDRMSLPVGANTVVETTISHQPNMPPEGKFSGYGSGNGGYIYRQYDGGLGDNSDWQPYPGHQWTKNGWNPYWGFFSITAHALQAAYPNGSYQTASGLLLSSAAQPGDNYGDQEEFSGVVAWDGNLPAKYKTHISSNVLSYPFDQIGSSGAADWCYWTQEQLFLNTRSGSLNIAKWNPTSGLTYPANMMSGTATTVVGGHDGSSGNGLLVRNLEHRKYLILQQGGTGTPGGFRGKLFIYSEDFGSGDARFIQLTPPPSVFSDWNGAGDCLSFCVDKNSRRVFWLVFPGVTIPVRFYVSTFNDLMNWTQIGTSPAITIPDLAYYDAWLAGNRQPLVFKDGYIYLFDGSGSGPSNPGYTDAAINLKRMKVDSGEDLPAMTFTRYDYRTQNFTFSSDPGTLQLWGAKHTNWAYDPVAGKHRHCAGDFGSSTDQSLATLQFSGSGPGDYLFSEVLNETTLPASGKVRPSSPDDGYWFYVPTDSAWVAARGKFVWQRGGDGEPMFYNMYLRSLYGSPDSNGTIAQVEAAIADGWDLASKYYLFDQATTSFTPLGAIYTFNPATAVAPPSSAGATYTVNLNGWTQDNGSTYFPSVWSAPSAASRNGAFDSTMGKVWRFYNTGSLSLASFDFHNKAIKFHSLAAWVSPETGRTYHTGGAMPASEGDVLADGTKEKFGYYDADSSHYIAPLLVEWEHKATWLDERDGKLYVVAPNTGYLWCVETRATPTDSGNGWVLPFYPVGKRIPFNGVYPAMNARNTYPPVPDSMYKDVRMQQFLVPFKGGLLFWGSVLHDSGTFGYPRYAFWRRLGYTGDWSVVTMPSEFAANSFSVNSRSYDNSEVVLLSGGYNYLDQPGIWPFFWRLT